MTLEMFDGRDVSVRIGDAEIPNISTAGFDDGTTVEAVDTATGCAGTQIKLTHGTLQVKFTAPPHLAILSLLGDYWADHREITCTLIHPNRKASLTGKLSHAPKISDDISKMAEVELEVVGTVGDQRYE